MTSHEPTAVTLDYDYASIDAVREDVNKLILGLIADRQKDASILSERYFEL